MIATIRIWWRRRSVREQRLLGVMAALLSAFVYVFGLWLPLERAHAAANERLTVAVAQRAAVAQQIARLRVLPNIAQRAVMTAETLRTSAQAAGFSVRNAQMLGAMRVTIDIDAARAPALFGWLASLEPQGVFVEQARLATRSDASLGVELVLRGATQ